MQDPKKSADELREEANTTRDTAADLDTAAEEVAEGEAAEEEARINKEKREADTD